MASYHIYILKDPKTQEIRYVGQTSRGLQVRLKEHISHGTRENNHRANWLRSLISENLQPLIESVEELPSKENLDSREIFWIRHYRDLGCKLTNSTDGGQGSLGFTDKHIRLSEEDWKNSYLNRRDKMREAVLKAFQKNPKLSKKSAWRRRHQIYCYDIETGIKTIYRNLDAVEPENRKHLNLTEQTFIIHLNKVWFMHLNDPAEYEMHKILNNQDILYCRCARCDDISDKAEFSSFGCLSCTQEREVRKKQSLLILEVSEKLCIKCKEIKPIESFSRSRRSICKECINKKNKIQYIKRINQEKQIPESKKCVRCLSIKTSKEFNNLSSSLDGLTPLCKECNKKDCKRRLTKTPKSDII